MERESFVFYGSFLDAMEELPNESQLKVFKAIAKFALKGVDPKDLKGGEKAIFLIAKPIILANNERYINGQKGGRPKTNSKINKKNHRLLNSKTNGYESAKPNVNVNVNDNVNENVNVNENGNGAEKEKEETNGKTTNDSFLNSPKTKTAETTNGKQQTTVPKGYQQLVDYLQEKYKYSESKAKLVANRVQSDKFNLTPEHCESFAIMSQEDIINSFDTMKKIKKLQSKSSFNSASRVLGNA